MRTFDFGLAVVLLALVGDAAWLRAEPTANAARTAESAAVDLFPALKSGVLTASVKPQFGYRPQVVLTNRTSRVLRVHLPAAAAAVCLNGGGGNQHFGGGFGGGGMGGGASALPVRDRHLVAAPTGPRPGRTIQLGPRATQTLTMHAVCLEHDKADPTPEDRYALRPLSDVTTAPAVARLLAFYDPARHDRAAIQAAVWHLANGIEWETLRSKTQMAPGRVEVRWLTRRQLSAARRLADWARAPSDGPLTPPLKLANKRP